MSRQKWGQHFLNNAKIARQICDAFHPRGAFGEIGPGTGALTQILTERFNSFLVFEIDSKLAEMHRNNSKLKVIEDDFLNWDFRVLGSEVENFSLIGNLPYESGSEMVKQVAFHSKQIDHFVFMLQKEVCERLTAKAHCRDFSSFTVLVRGQYDIQKLMDVSPKAFNPPPQVDSQVIVGRRRAAPHSMSPGYLKFLRMAFAQKRKTLKNNFKSLSTPAGPFDFETLRSHFGLSETCRAEEIDIDQWPQIFEKACRLGLRE